MSAKQPDKH